MRGSTVRINHENIKRNGESRRNERLNRMWGERQWNVRRGDRKVKGKQQRNNISEWHYVNEMRRTLSHCRIVIFGKKNKECVDWHCLWVKLWMQHENVVIKIRDSRVTATAMIAWKCGNVMVQERWELLDFTVCIKEQVRITERKNSTYATNGREWKRHDTQWQLRLIVGIYHEPRSVLNNIRRRCPKQNKTLTLLQCVGKKMKWF